LPDQDCRAYVAARSIEYRRLASNLPRSSPSLTSGVAVEVGRPWIHAASNTAPTAKQSSSSLSRLPRDQLRYIARAGNAYS
jgi:hypothetical protein